MGTIRTSIELYDGMTPALKAITNSLNVVISNLKGCKEEPHEELIERH